jgi:hypothetical protein
LGEFAGGGSTALGRDLALDSNESNRPLKRRLPVAYRETKASALDCNLNRRMVTI